MVEEQVERHQHRSTARSSSDADSVSTWITSVSVGCDEYVYGTLPDTSDSASIANSSTISGFDIISLNGTSSQLACQRCTFLNRMNNLFCTICCTPLTGPNPCTDTDAILARQIQEQESAFAFAATQQKEAKRKNLFVQQLFLVQSRILTEDVFRFMSKFKSRKGTYRRMSIDRVGYDALPNHSMVMLASRFIETMTNYHRSGMNSDVLIRYCITNKSDIGASYQNIIDNGFPANTKFSSVCTGALHQRDPLTTITNYGRPQTVSYSTSRRNPGNALGVIPEDEDIAASIHPLQNNLGWIAVIVKNNETLDVWSHNDTKCATWVINPNQTLPLICFDVSLATNPSTTYLMQCLLSVYHEKTN